MLGRIGSRRLQGIVRTASPRGTFGKRRRPCLSLSTAPISHDESQSTAGKPPQESSQHATRKTKPAGLKAINAADRNQMIDITHRLLQMPLGWMSTKAWEDGKLVLQWWALQKPMKGTENLLGDFNLASRLLERMLNEQYIEQESKPSLTPMDVSEMLRQMTDQWYDMNFSKAPTNAKLQGFVQYIMIRFDVRPCDHVLNLLQIDPEMLDGGSTQESNVELKQKRQSNKDDSQLHPLLPDSSTSEFQLYQETLATLSPEEQMKEISQRLHKRLTEISNSQNLLDTEPATSSKSKTITSAEDDQLAASILLNFVRNWSAAGLRWSHAQQKVEEFMSAQKIAATETNGNDSSKAKRAYTFALQAWADVAKRKPRIAAKQADKLLYEMLTEYLENGNHVIKPSKQCFLSAVVAHVRSGKGGDANRVLQDMLQLYRETGDATYMPDLQMFQSVLLSLIKKSKDKNTIYTADTVLRQLMDLALETKDPSLVPLDIFVEYVLQGWSRSFDTTSGQAAEAILLRIQELNNIHKPGYRPPLKFFDLLLHSWANSQVPKARARVEDIVVFVKKNFGKQGEELVPPSFGYLPLLLAWSRWCWGKPQESVERVENYFKLFQSHFDTDQVSSLNVILAYRCRIRTYAFLKNPYKAAKESQKAFTELLLLYESQKIDKLPDVTVYADVAYAWAKAGNFTRVRNIMEQVSCDLNLSPDTVMYNNLLLAFSRSKEPTAAEQAEEVLAEMEKANQKGDEKSKPDIRTYGNVMTCLSESNHPVARSRAEFYLQKLKDIHTKTGNSRYKPNKKIYTIVMKSFMGGNASSVEKAQALIDEMTTLAKRGDESLLPDNKTFTVFLQVLRTSNVPDKASRAVETLSQMNQNGISLDRFLEQELSRIASAR